MHAIETRILRKQYGNRLALEGLTLQVEQGEVFGFLGPNGAGKTTAIKILTGLVKPTDGEALVFGKSPEDLATRRRIGFLPENFKFHEWLTGSELLDFHGRLAGLNEKQRAQQVPRVLALVGLEGHGDKRVRAYSKGMQQRLGIGQALLANPDLVMLDEPTSALDPLGRREVRDLLRRLRSEGVTVFLNSHLLSEIEMVCDHVAIIDRGKVVRQGNLNELLAGEHELRITLDRVDEGARAILAEFGSISSIESLALVLQVSDVKVAPRVARRLMENGYELYGMTPIHRSLEELFAESVEGGEG